MKSRLIYPDQKGMPALAGISDVQFGRLMSNLLLGLILIALLAACTSSDDESAQTGEVGGTEVITGEPQESSSAGTDLPTIAAKPSPVSSMLPGMTVTDFVVVSSRRTGRTVMEYVLGLKVSSSSTPYDGVLATLSGVPSHITVIDNSATIGKVPPNSTILSQDTFTLLVDLSISTSFDDFIWIIDGDVNTPPPPPPPGSRPDAPGIYMNIDDLRIPGEATSDSHQNWIELTSVMDGIRREGLAAGSSRRRSSFVFDGLEVTKLLDKSGPKLREAIAQGTIFTEVEIDIIASCGGNTYTAFAITLSIARIDGFASSAEADRVPGETVSFEYTRIETMYTPVRPDCGLEPPIYATQDGEILEL